MVQRLSTSWVVVIGCRHKLTLPTTFLRHWPEVVGHSLSMWALVLFLRRSRDDVPGSSYRFSSHFDLRCLHQSNQIC